MMMFRDGIRTKHKLWCVFIMFMVAVLMEVTALNGSNVCMVQQKYNITKRVKYRAPMSVRTYEWCFAMPPRCSKWNTEMRDLTRLETEERVAEVAVCCPGYKMMDVSCVPICPNGKTGPGCSEDCPDNKWGPNCIHDCKKCKNGFCSPLTGECECLEGWQGESCDNSMPTATSTSTLEELTTLTTKPVSLNTTPRTTTSSSTTTTIKITTARVIPSSKPTEPVTSSTSSTTFRMPSTEQMTTTVQTVKDTDKTSLIISTEPTRIFKTENIKNTVDTEYITPFTFPNSVVLTPVVTTKASKPIEEVTQRIVTKPIDERAQAPSNNTKSTETIKMGESIELNQKPSDVMTTTEMSKPTIPLATKEITFVTETTKKDTTIRMFPTTVKTKPKEIWIRPAQKGESSIVESNIKSSHDFPRYRSANKDFTPSNTTPKTIIVSIIPTSVSYSTFKKIVLTTASYLAQKNITKAYKKTEHESTKPMPVTTFTPQTMTTLKPNYTTTLPITNITTVSVTSPMTNIITKSSKTVIKEALTTPESTILVTKSLEIARTVPFINQINSMRVAKTSTMITSSTNAKVFKVSTTTKTSIKDMHSTTAKMELTVSSKNQTIGPILKPNETDTILLTPTVKHSIAVTEKNKDTTVVVPQQKIKASVTPKEREYQKATRKDFKKTNATKPLIITSTDEPDDEEFHILTEPEHITAVMGDKGGDRTSVDLISVISIAGGVMMAVITVAVIIVMLERCKKPRYEDVRKINDNIRMQVMIDNDDVPPPYVRSIFHTPLPDPPSMEKCHYQPISTLDRNLKQFMRPVVVQNISPIMLENFRGILECHYDHLPRRRSHDFGTMQTRFSAASSMSDCNELRYLPVSVTESTIEAMKCEAKLDVIDNSTSEPLYAEIPCWRPPSEHAIEIMNLNGEAITDL